MNDMDLAKTVADGDRVAMASLVEQHYDPVFRFLRNLTRSQEDAEDLTQQVFVKAQTRIKSYRGGSSLRTWLHQIAFHEFTRWRRRRRLTSLVGIERTGQEPGYSQVDEAAWLLDALDRLNPALKEAFLLHEVQELSVEEVATVTGSPIGTVKSRLHHARSMLQKLWESTHNEESYERTATQN